MNTSTETANNSSLTNKEKNKNNIKMKERIFSVVFLLLTTIGYWFVFLEWQDVPEKYNFTYFSAFISYFFYVGLSVIVFYESFKSK